VRTSSRRLVACGLLLLACERPAPAPPAGVAEAPDEHGFSPPTRHTAEANAALARELPLADAQDFEDAGRGLVASEPGLEIRAADGHVIWSPAAFAFVEGDAPASVNPSLWRQAQLDGLHGLFQVADGIYQVRGYDVSNMSWIRGSRGWIVVDPLTSQETAAAAYALARKHLGDAPVTALVFTHSHVDHFGGVEAVLPADAADVRIVAPLHFVEEATSENVLAGTTMGRRAEYMFGLDLPRGPRAYVDSGLGKAPVRGTLGLRLPTDLVDHTPQELELDGVPFVFQYAPDSEAPAELSFYLPERKAWCAAELATHTQHNLLTLRGAKVRDALKWSGYIDEALRLFGDAEVVFASHHWPVWGNERVIAYLKGQRDTYRYLHDQTLRLASLGLTPQEIAEELSLPEALSSSFANRGYYGTVSHNSKAVYQRYFGWFDGNPAHLDPLPPAEAGARYVEAVGGAAELKRKAREAFERGEYRWAATLLDHLVFAQPGDAEARELLARCYDQLGYQAESGPWRSIYLSGAYELRHGVASPGLSLASAQGLLEHVPLDQFFAAMATRLRGPEAAGKRIVLNFVFRDLGQTFVLTLENGVLHHEQRPADPDAGFTLRLSHDFFLRLTTGQAGLREAIFSDELDVEGSRTELLAFFRLLEQPDGRFPIVTP
jgi:alkyl sulfatase BDS1-like metallo-beta-lactamase superfamily hydrolase